MQLPMQGFAALSTLRSVLAGSQAGAPGQDTAKVDGTGFLPCGARVQRTREMGRHTAAPKQERSWNSNVVGETNAATLGTGRTGSRTLPWSKVGTRGNTSLLGEKRAEKRRSRKRRQPEQRLRGGAEQGLCTIPEQREVTAARPQRAWNIRGLQLQRQHRPTPQSSLKLMLSILKLAGST